MSRLILVPIKRSDKHLLVAKRSQAVHTRTLYKLTRNHHCRGESYKVCVRRALEPRKSMFLYRFLVANFKTLMPKWVKDYSLQVHHALHDEHSSIASPKKKDAVIVLSEWLYLTRRFETAAYPLLTALEKRYVYSVHPGPHWQ